MDLLTWLIVGLVAGLLASVLMKGSGFGVVGDILLGIVGAFVGSWPSSGSAGTRRSRGSLA